MQFRFPSGGKLVHSFPTSTAIEAVAQFVAQAIQDNEALLRMKDGTGSGGDYFELNVAYPRSSLSQLNRIGSLAEHGLVKDVAIIVQGL